MGLALALLAVGCAGSRRGDSPDGVPRDALREQPPPFFTGPAAAFLTNLDSYSAAVALTIQPGAAGARVISGQLVDGRQILFEPAPASGRTFLGVGRPWRNQYRAIVSKAVISSPRCSH